MTPRRDDLLDGLLLVVGGVVVLALVIFAFASCSTGKPAGSPSWFTDVNNIETADKAAVYYEKASLYYEAVAKGFVESRRSGQCNDACWQTFASYRDRVGVTALQVGTGIEVWRAGGGKVDFAMMYPIFVKAIQDVEAQRGN